MLSRVRVQKLEVEKGRSSESRKRAEFENLLPQPSEQPAKHQGKELRHVDVESTTYSCTHRYHVLFKDTGRLRSNAAAEALI